MSSDYRNMTRAELVRALEELERERHGSPPDSPNQPYEQVLHNLHVHQAELQAQNQSLRETQLLLEESRNRYAELYDLAPLGYVTLNPQGLIREINLTGAALLGVERSA